MRISPIASSTAPPPSCSAFSLTCSESWREFWASDWTSLTLASISVTAAEVLAISWVNDSTLRATSLFETSTSSTEAEVCETFSERAPALRATCSIEAIISMIEEEVSSEVRASCSIVRETDRAWSFMWLMKTEISSSERDCAPAPVSRPAASAETSPTARSSSWNAAATRPCSSRRLREHVVEGGVEIVDLVPGPGLDGLGQVALGHRVRGDRRAARRGRAIWRRDEEHDQRERRRRTRGRP